MTNTIAPIAKPSPFLEVKTNEDFHPNGQLAYTETVAVLPAESAHLYNSTRRIHPDGYSWIRVGRQAKYHDNGQLAWAAEYDETGKRKKPEQTQYRKDGSAIVY